MDDITMKLLTIIRERGSLTLTTLAAIINVDEFDLVSPINHLISMEYLEICPNVNHRKGDPLSLDTPFRLTYKAGTAIYAEQKAQKHFKYREFRAWVTLLIAVIALIISIISLLQG